MARKTCSSSDGFAALVATIAAFIGFGGPGRRPPTRAFNLREDPRKLQSLIFSNPLAKFCFGGVFIEGVFLLGVYPFVAPMLHDGGETRASIAGIVIAGFGVGGIIYSMIIGTIPAAQLGQRNLMILGGFLQGAGIMAMSFQPVWQMQLAIFVLFGCAFYLLHGSIQIFQSRSLRPGARVRRPTRRALDVLLRRPVARTDFLSLWICRSRSNVCAAVRWCDPDDQWNNLRDVYCVSDTAIALDALIRGPHVRR